MPDQFLKRPIGAPFIELNSIDSTNNYALERLHAGLAQHGTCFFAHEQVSGKGQMGKTWVAGKDSSLILSVVLDPSPLKTTEQFHLSACIAVAAARFFNRFAGPGTKIKWPNDIYWQDRKAGGILIENIIGTRTEGPNAQSNSWKWAVAGIGINLNQATFPPGLRAVSLTQITGKEYDPAVMAKLLCLDIEETWQLLLSKGFETIYEQYLSNFYKLGETLEFRKDSRIFSAIVKGVTKQGKLLLQHGITEEYELGQVEWLLRD